MTNIKKNFILVLSLILLFAVSCSNDDKTGGETETAVTIDAKDFPTELLGRYKDDRLSDGYSSQTEVSTTTDGKTKIEGPWLIDDGTSDAPQNQVAKIEKWKKTTKDGKIIKLEGECSDSSGVGKYIITYDYASGTLSGKYTHPDGTWSFNGKKIS